MIHNNIGIPLFIKIDNKPIYVKLINAFTLSLSL